MRRWPRFVVGVVVFLAGCGSMHKASTTTTSTASTPSTASPGTTAGTVRATTESSPPSTSGSVPTTVPPSVRLCASSQLAASLGSPNGAAGTVYYQLGLRNSSQATCLVQGYPGVSYVTGADGHQVGSPATRVAGATPMVALTPGQSASATLAIVDATNFGPGCQVTGVLGLRVYPPDQTAALFVPHTDQACANVHDQTLRIGASQSA